MIHHSAVSYTKNADQFKANNNYHKSLWNFKSSLGYYLGYNYEISSKGKVRKARNVGTKTAACYQKDMNDGRCIHICLDGNFDTEKPKPAQIFALRDLVLELTSKFDIKKENIVPHSDYAPKTCPGINLDIQFIRNLVPGKIEEPKVKTQIIDLLGKLTELIKKL